MAIPCTYHNFPSAWKDELIGNALRALTKGSGTSTPIFAVFCTSTPMPA